MSLLRIAPGVFDASFRSYLGFLVKEEAIFVWDDEWLALAWLSPVLTYVSLPLYSQISFLLLLQV